MRVVNTCIVRLITIPFQRSLRYIYLCGIDRPSDVGLLMDFRRFGWLRSVLFLEIYSNTARLWRQWKTAVQQITARTNVTSF